MLSKILRTDIVVKGDHTVRKLHEKHLKSNKKM